MDVCKIIKDAECCAGKMAHKIAMLKTYGNENEALLQNLLTINAYIRTLKRNVPRHYTKKVPISNEGKIVDFSSLKRRNNVLILDTEQKYKCIEVCVPACLTDKEICRISEEIDSICSSCNCNCN